MPGRHGPSRLALGATMLAVPVWTVVLLTIAVGWFLSPVGVPVLVGVTACAWVPMAWLVAYRLAPRLLPGARIDQSVRRSVRVLVCTATLSAVTLGVAMGLLDQRLWWRAPYGLRGITALTLMLTVYLGLMFLLPTLAGCTVYLLRQRRLRACEAG